MDLIRITTDTIHPINFLIKTFAIEKPIQMRLELFINLILLVFIVKDLKKKIGLKVGFLVEIQLKQGVTMISI